MTRQAPLAVLALLLSVVSAVAAEPATSWKVKDTQNNALTVPTDKTSVLVFLRADQLQSQKAIEQLHGALKTRQDLQMIALVSGEDAAQAAAKLSVKDSKWIWPVVTDPLYAASGKYAVRSWPTTVVISKSGEQISHIAGLPPTYANDLVAYLDFAAGKLDQAALEKRLADPGVVVDSSDQKAARHVQVAWRLAEKGAKDPARAELAKAVDFKPANPTLHLTMARIHLMLGDPKNAQLCLAKLTDPAALVPGELQLLQGWTALQLQQWDQAQTHLTTALKLNPQPSEANYLLGLVWAHQGDQTKAAECFRKAFEHTPTGRTMIPVQ